MDVPGTGSFFLELGTWGPPSSCAVLSSSPSKHLPVDASSTGADRGGLRARSVAREFELESARFFADVVQVFGVPKSVGLIYGILYGATTPLSFSDIVARLQISKGSASQGLQLLRTLGAITIVDAPPAAQGCGAGQVISTHREYFCPELSLRKLVTSVLRERAGPISAGGNERIERLRQLAAEDRENRAFYRDRIRQLDTWRRILKSSLPVLATLLGAVARE